MSNPITPRIVTTTEGSTGAVRVGVLDGHPVVCWGIDHALRDCVSIRLTCSASRPEDLAVADVDVLLLDLNITSEVPSALIARLSQETRVILMSASADADDIRAGLVAGASGVLDKSARRGEIIQAIETVAGGGVVAAPVRQAEADRAAEHGLSHREQQVVVMIGSGLTHEQTARRLGVSKHTVDTYVKRVRAKLNLGNKAELARLAQKLGAGTSSR